jgi:hypothetical protein
MADLRPAVPDQADSKYGRLERVLHLIDAPLLLSDLRNGLLLSGRVCDEALMFLELVSHSGLLKV